MNVIRRMDFKTIKTTQQIVQPINGLQTIPYKENRLKVD